MDKIQWYSLSQLTQLQAKTLVKCMGVVKTISKDSNYFSFVIAHGEHQAEASIYQDQKIYSMLDLPTYNDPVIVLGYAYRKQLNSKTSFSKITVRLFRIIDNKQAQKMAYKIEQSQKNKKLSQQVGPQSRKKRSEIKQLKSSVQAVEIRSLILSYLYLTLLNNQDINSYTFTISAIKSHPLTKSYLTSKNLKVELVEYLAEYIHAELMYLVDHQVIEQKEAINGHNIYKINRNFYTQIQMRTMGIINTNQKTGTVLQDIVKTLNREHGFVEQKNYIFNDNFIQKILMKFIGQSRIYKTSQKKLYPNS